MTSRNSIRICSVDGCDGKHLARGYCHKHYQRWSRNSTTELQTTAERFWTRVDKSSVCWNWTSYCNGQGYGYFGVSGKTARAHRYSWELHNGPIPEGVCVLHKCDNRKCVRPNHLILGSHADNMADMTAKGRGAIGIRHGMAKITESDVRSIRQRYAQEDISQRTLAGIFGIDRTSVGSIVNRKSWSHI